MSQNIDLADLVNYQNSSVARKADIKYTTFMKVKSGTVNKPSVQTMAKILLTKFILILSQ